MKASKILKKILKEIEYDNLFLSQDFIANLEIIEAIEELEELIAKDKSKNCEECYNKTALALKKIENKSCDGCKHLESREELLKDSCLIEVCRSCKRSNIDNWEQK